MIRIFSLFYSLFQSLRTASQTLWDVATVKIGEIEGVWGDFLIPEPWYSTSLLELSLMGLATVYCVYCLIKFLLDIIF